MRDRNELVILIGRLLQAKDNAQSTADNSNLVLLWERNRIGAVSLGVLKQLEQDSLASVNILTDAITMLSDFKIGKLKLAKSVGAG